MDVDRPCWGSTLVKNHEENKTFILVKLSESFSNAIQEYSAQTNLGGSGISHNSNNSQNHLNLNGGSSLQVNNHHNNKRAKLHHNNIVNDSGSNSNNNHAINRCDAAPTIKFQGTRGAIRFPNGKSYDFSLEQSDNTVECIRQTKNKWESVGKMACCLHVKGKDDVYQRTRTKMEAAEQEKRKYCTKLLGSPEHNTTTTATSSITKTTKLLENNKSSLLLSSSSSNTNNPNNHNHSHNNHNHNHSSNHNHNKLHQNNNHNQNSQNHNNYNQNNNHSQNNHHSQNNNHSNNLHTTNKNNHNNNIGNTNSQTIVSRYPDITDDEQMKKYKADFEREFKEYQNLHGYLRKIEDRFRKFKESLKQSVEGSPEWESIRDQTYREFDRLKSDSQFHKVRSKYRQLTINLAHIKKKIKEREQRDKELNNNNTPKSKKRK